MNINIIGDQSKNASQGNDTQQAGRSASNKTDNATKSGNSTSEKNSKKEKDISKTKTTKSMTKQADESQDQFA